MCTIGFAIAVVHFSAHDLGQKDAMVAGIDVARRLALQVADRVLENRHAASTVRDFQSFERRLARLESLCRNVSETASAIRRRDSARTARRR